MKYGEKFDLQNVVLIKWLKNFMFVGVFKFSEELFLNNNVDVCYILCFMESGELILVIKILESGEGVGLIMCLFKGMCVFVICVDVVSGVLGFLCSGDRVDVYWIGFVCVVCEGGNCDIIKLI